jgi:hypothetical protein
MQIKSPLGENISMNSYLHNEILEGSTLTNKVMNAGGNGIWVDKGQKLE